MITGELQTAARERGLFYPPDPASSKECSIGGNIATNAGGPRCLKYGVTRSYVLGLEVVLADGRVLRTGSRTHKNKTGFDLIGLFVGSEGLLGIVTEATLRLLPQHRRERPSRRVLRPLPRQRRRSAGNFPPRVPAGPALEIADDSPCAARANTAARASFGRRGTSAGRARWPAAAVRAEAKDWRAYCERGGSGGRASVW